MHANVNERKKKNQTSQMPLTRYPKKKPDEQMRNCCHLGLSIREIPNRDRDCSSFFISLSVFQTRNREEEEEE